jgi:hypothetical protein
VASRMCPHCGNTVPAGRVVAFSDDVVCPHCQTLLQVVDGSRMIAVAVGLVAAWIAWLATRASTNVLGFAIPVLFSFLAFGIVSPLVLIFTAALRIAPTAPVFDPVPTHGTHAPSVHGHAGGHH